MKGVFYELNGNEFVDLWNRSTRKGYFSVENLQAIYEDLWDQSDNIDEPVLVDIIELCGLYSQLTLENFKSQFEEYKDMTQEEIESLDQVINIDSDDLVLFREE